MSASPQPSGPTTVVSPLTGALSPTNTAVTPGGTGPSNSQLADMLSTSYREAEALRRELTAARKRAEKAENILSNIFLSGSDGSSSQQPMPGGSNSCNNRLRKICVQLAEQARDEADARRRVLMEQWAELDRHLNVMEIRAADARAGYSRIVAEGGGQLVLAPISLPGQLSGPPPLHLHQNTGITLMPPTP